MVTPQRKVGWLTPTSPPSADRKEKKKVSVSVSPESRAPEAPVMDVNGGSPVNENEMWKRLREVGLDEETLQKKDKASLISYITKLEAELHLPEVAATWKMLDFDKEITEDMNLHTKLPCGVECCQNSTRLRPTNGKCLEDEELKFCVV